MSPCRGTYRGWGDKEGWRDYTVSPTSPTSPERRDSIVPPAGGIEGGGEVEGGGGLLNFLPPNLTSDPASPKGAKERASWGAGGAKPKVKL